MKSTSLQFRRFLFLFIVLVQAPPIYSATAAEGSIDLIKLYKHLHANPELSFQEKTTSKMLALKFRQLGFAVTEGVGGYGVVAIMKNGDGPSLMLRADMDALPIMEQTGLDYASTIKVTNESGEAIPVMHACGHDMHMTVVVGAAQRLTTSKEDWRGTLILIAQPAEERGAGAKAMLSDGLFERCPRPDYNLSMHVSAELPAGKIGYTRGFGMANVDSVDILIRGIGGHGAYPHKTKDPIIIAANLINWLQTIISREISPLESAVITVGSIHGGSKHNIIGDEVKLQLTVRSYSDETRNYLLKRISEMSENVARTAGIPENLLPIVHIKDEYTPAVYNDPAFIDEIVDILQSTFGNNRIVPVQPVMAGEDFARYGRENPKIPSALLWLGSVAPSTYVEALENGASLPSLHSPQFAPLPQSTIATGVQAMTEIALNLLSPTN